MSRINITCFGTSIVYLSLKTECSDVGPYFLSKARVNPFLFSCWWNSSCLYQSPRTHSNREILLPEIRGVRMKCLGPRPGCFASSDRSQWASSLWESIEERRKQRFLPAPGLEKASQ